MMYNTFALRWILLVCSLLGPICCFSSNITDSIPTTSSSDTITLNEVIVYGQSDRLKEIIPSHTLSGETLSSLNSHSVADAVRYFSGVQLKDYGGVGGVKTLDVRSMGTNHMGVFYDGIQLGNAQNGQIDLGKFSLDNVESISLYNGQRSSIFQGAKDFGSAGTIYITTRRPKFGAGRSSNYNFTFRTGSFGLLNPSFRFERKLSNTLSLSANVEYTYATGKYHFRYKRVLADGTPAWDTTATRHNGDVKAFRAEAGLFGSAQKTKWYAKLYFYDSERGIPGAIVNNVWKSSQRQWDRNFFMQGNWQYHISPQFQTCISAKYARDYMRYLNPDTTLMYLDNHFTQNEIYLSSANCYTISQGLDLNLAVDYQFNNLSSSLNNFSNPQRHSLMSALAMSWRLSSFRMQASMLYSFITDKSQVRLAETLLKNKTNNLSKFTPAVFLTYIIPGIHSLRLQGFYKKIFRMPTFNDLYYTDVGSAGLKPEYATQYDIGATWNISSSRSSFLNETYLSIDAYHNRISDKIIAVPKGNGQYRWMMMNIGKVRIWGVDVTANGEFSLPYSILLNARITYTWQRALDYSDPSDCIPPAGSYRSQIAYVPQHSGSLVLNAQWKRLSLSYSFIYVGERWHTSSNIPINYEQPWYTSDISASWTQPMGKFISRLTLEVNNLLNQQYEVIQNYPMPGRNYKLIIQCDF